MLTDEHLDLMDAYSREPTFFETSQADVPRLTAEVRRLRAALFDAHMKSSSSSCRCGDCKAFREATLAMVKAKRGVK